jgi:hypothetical protein
MARERPAGRFVACAHPERELIDDIWPPKVVDGPTLAVSVPADKPSRHHKRYCKSIRLDLLKIAGRLAGERHAAQDAFVIKARLMFKCKMPKLVGGSKTLDTHRPPGGDENARGWIVKVGAQ